MTMSDRLPARPFVSFVMATHNRGQVLVDCLRRTLACGLPAAQFSITVVDNASTDLTRSLVTELARSHQNLRLIPLDKNGGPVAKNVALHRNAADIIVLLDDDAYPQPGAVPQMIRHFQDDPRLGAAVFDVSLPDGSKEASAYPDVFIGAGTALRGAALRKLPGGGLLPRDFFMQAEEYDLSFRMLANGWSVQRFWDMPLMHLKTPGARIGHRTTRLDVRNNLWLLARYVPAPLCHQFSADWLARYWRMAVQRDDAGRSNIHRGAFLRGAAEGLTHWREKSGGGAQHLSAEVIERIFKFETIATRLRLAREQLGLRRIAFGDWGKNMLAFFQAARQAGVEISAVIDGNLSGDRIDYRGIPVMDESTFRRDLEPTVDAVIITALSRVHAQRRAAALRRTLSVPVIDLFARHPQPASSPPSSDDVVSTAVLASPVIIGT